MQPILQRLTSRKKYLLDKIPGAVASYALERLYANYKGPLIRAYRPSDGVEQDIFAKQDGKIDTTAISNFCSVEDAEVSVWYDQSGNGNHANAIQGTPSLRPKIALAGVYNTDGIVFDGSNDFFNITDVSNVNITTPPLSLFFEVKHNAAGSGYIFARDVDTAASMQYGMLYNGGTLKYEAYLEGAARAASAAITGGVNGKTNKVGFIWNGATQVYLNGAVSGTTTGSVASLTTKPNIFMGVRAASSGLPINGAIKYLLIFNKDISNYVNMLP